MSDDYGSDILPSFMRAKRVDQKPMWEKRIVNDFSLHMGEVVAVYAPKDDGNYSKVVYEYDVDCLIGDNGAAPTRVLYSRCHLQSYFGGLGDKFVWAPRVRVKNDDNTIDPGSKVLVLALNGVSRQGIIVGGIQPDRYPEEVEALAPGPFLNWQYNGVDITINKDGELILQRLGPTKNKLKGGKVEFVTDNDKKANASLKLDKDGKVIVQTGDEKQVITMDLNNGTIELKADKGVKINVANGKVETVSTGVKLGGDSEHLILGDTYTGAEGEFLDALTKACSQLIPAFATMAGNPVTEPAAQAASGQIIPVFVSLIQDIAKFRAKVSAQVLSRKNTTE